MKRRNSWIVYFLVTLILTLIGWQLFKYGHNDLICHKDYEYEQLLCRPGCKYGYFSLPWMEECRKWLTCKEIRQDVHIQRGLGSGAVKVAYLATWKDHDVVLNTLVNNEYEEDFRHGMSMVARLQPTPHVVQFLGHCGNVFITEYHKFGTAENLQSLLKDYPHHGSLSRRFKLCINYVEILAFLHDSPQGTRVMCDSNYLSKTLSQYLLQSDFTLLVNDLDALPEVDAANGKLIKCGHRMITSDFAAPEQRWEGDDEFEDDLVMPYDEKTDIWKIPEVCEHFLGNIEGTSPLLFNLFQIHKKCKMTDPKDRPSAIDVLKEYHVIKEKLDLNWGEL